MMTTSIQLKTVPGVRRIRSRPTRLVRQMDRDRVGSVPALPRISPSLLRLFRAYSRWYLSRHFHSLRIARTSETGSGARSSGMGAIPLSPDVPLVVYTNHASWWDPLTCLVLADEVLPERVAYAPMDTQALARYGFFAKLGFFGVDQARPRGAVAFLRTSTAILRQRNAALWLTPQARFSDVRERPLKFKPGLGALASHAENALFLPLALEYVFWEERTPEVLAMVGEPIRVSRGGTDGEHRLEAEAFTALFEERLQSAQDVLGDLSQRRDPAAFHTLLRGRAGVGGLYDVWRTVKAYCRGETFQRKHGRK